MVDLHKIGPQILVVDIAIFNIVGNFGNFNLIWSTVRKKEMRSKAGYLLAINAVYQSVCLISQLVNLVVIVTNVSIERRTCYPIVVPFIITCSQQATMAFAIALDLLIALVFPLR
ncbi:hypothetical protein Y032_0087g2051 [Ancylostoma ceylanicum]|uniref:G-protein coupled receptors family 1 profile domain-containing protein n=1 Tax=Ancylostoma ceylanicum TaxID=53326 RepID=A0A016TNF6_9BILA|nr:hypothetical protein Y032_0087g2051 [Ancylostoma ceylanicum]